MESTKKVNPNTDEPKKSVSWRAIFAGTLTVLSILLILNLIGFAFGMGTIEPTEGTNPLRGTVTGALIWWIVPGKHGTAAEYARKLGKKILPKKWPIT